MEDVVRHMAREQHLVADPHLAGDRAEPLGVGVPQLARHHELTLASQLGRQQGEGSDDGFDVVPRIPVSRAQDEAILQKRHQAARRRCRPGRAEPPAPDDRYSGGIHTHEIDEVLPCPLVNHQQRVRQSESVAT
jgi:hypothetical protein